MGDPENTGSKKQEGVGDDIPTAWIPARKPQKILRFKLEILALIVVAIGIVGYFFLRPEKVELQGRYIYSSGWKWFLHNEEFVEFDGAFGLDYSVFGARSDGNSHIEIARSLIESICYASLGNLQNSKNPVATDRNIRPKNIYRVRMFFEVNDGDPMGPFDVNVLDGKCQTVEFFGNLKWAYHGNLSPWLNAGYRIGADLDKPVLVVVFARNRNGEKLAQPEGFPFQRACEAIVADPDYAQQSFMEDNKNFSMEVLAGIDFLLEPMHAGKFWGQEFQVLNGECIAIDEPSET